MQRITLRKIMLILLVVVALTCTALVGMTACNTEPATTAEANASFGSLANGTKYQYSTKDGESEVTVQQSGNAHGTLNNPFVITNATQWNAFADLVSAGSTNKDTVVVLGNNINFNGGTPKQIGTDDQPFKGKFFGQKCKLTNAVIGSATVGKFKAYALFGKVEGTTLQNGTVQNAVIADFSVTGCTVNGTKETPGGLLVSVISAWASKTDYINVSVRNNVSLTGTTSTDGRAFDAGVYSTAFNGVSYGDLGFYKCTYVGTINHAAGERNAGYDTQVEGCLNVTANFKNSVIIADSCYIDVVWNMISGEAQGGVFGHNYWPTEDGSHYGMAAQITLTNSYIRGILQGSISTKDSANFSLLGHNPGTGASRTVDNVYAIGNMRFEDGATIATNTTVTQSDNSLCNGGVSAANPSNGFITYDNDAAGQAAVKNDAQTGLKDNPNFVFNDDGSIGLKGEAGSYRTYHITYNLGADSGVSWLSDPQKDFTEDATDKGVVVAPLATLPSRPDYDFKGWNLAKDGTAAWLNGTNKYFAGQTNTNVTLYAIWEIKNPTVTALAGNANNTIDYENDAEFGWTVALEDAATTDVTVSYAWTKDGVAYAASAGVDGKNISVVSDGKITFTKPATTQSGAYKLTVTLTPNGGTNETAAAKTITEEITFTVNKFQVDSFTVPSGATYGKDASGNETPFEATYANTADATRYTFAAGTTKFTTAGDHTTTATLNDATNYAWKDSTGVTGATKSITWNIAKADVALPTILTTSFIYGKTERSLTITANENLVNIGGTTKAENAGTYAVTFSLVDANNYKWVSTPAGAANAEVASYSVDWEITKLEIEKPTLKYAEMSYTDEILTNLPDGMTDGVTFVTTGTNQGEDVGTYNAEFYLLTYDDNGTTKCNYRWKGETDATKESAPFTIEWNIIRRLVKLPIISSEALVYSESDQTKVTADPADADKYTFVNNSNIGNSATNYDTIVRLNDPANNRWEVTVADGMVFDATAPETGDIHIAWSIAKANINVTDKPVQNGKIYVGQTWDAFKFGVIGSEEHFLGGTAMNASHPTVPVAGHFEWEIPSDKLTKGQTQVNIKYVPADPTNYASVTVPMDVVTTQLQVVVKEVDKNLQYQDAYNGAIISDKTYDIDYGKVFTFATDTDKNNVLAKYPGYSIHYYERYRAADGKADGELMNLGVTITEITVTEELSIMKATDDERIMQATIYVGYVAEAVDYEVYHIYQRPDGGASTPTEIGRAVISWNESENRWVVGGLDEYVKLEKFQADADTRLTAEFRDVLGFTATDSLNDDCRSYYMNVDIEGDGSSKLYIYYERERHTVYWQLNGGRLSGMNNVEVKYSGAEINGNNVRPTRTGYKFVGWYTDTTLQTAAKWPVTMLDKNLNFYAKWEAIPHYITVDYNQGSENDGIADSLHGYVFEGVEVPHEYSIDDFKGGQVITLPRPTAAGFEFAGWKYVNEDGEAVIIDYIDDTFTGDIALVASWRPAMMTIELKLNNGQADAVWRSIAVENFGKYPTLPDPTERIGYEFMGWYTDPVNGKRIKADDTVKLVESQTLYARWKALEYTFTFPADYNSWTGVTLTKNGAPMAQSSKVTVGDKIVMTLNPNPGYVVKRIKIGGSTYTGAVATWTVQARTGNTIPVEFEQGYADYNITLYNQGGRLTSGGDYNSYTKKFNISTQRADMNLPDASDLARVGYEFGGWAYYDDVQDPEHTSQYTIDLNEEESWRQFRAFAKDMTLYAIWNPASHNIVLNYNYPGASETGTASGLTGEKVSIASPTREDYTFIGWATSANGAVEFAPNGYTEQQADLVADPVDYTIPEVTGDITLYAKWALTKIGFVALSTGNNNALYGNTITISGKPYKMYIDATNVSITYRWYKVEALHQFTKEENADKEGLYDLTNAVKVGNDLVVGKDSAHPLDYLPTLDITKVNESGIYVCQAVSTDGATTTEGHGAIEITMRKADYKGIAMSNNTLVYDGQQHSLAISGVTVNNGEFALDDGSTVRVTYTYSLDDRFVASDSVKNVGNYTVKASFEYTEDGDKGNYNLPDPITAFLNVTPKTLKASGITFEMQMFDGTNWVALNSGVFNAEYTENMFRIVAKSNEIVAGDDAVIVLTQSASGTAKGEAKDVGKYEALLENVAGANASNYVLGQGMPTRDWRITPGTRDMTNVAFTDKEVEYDGSEQLLTITGTLPDAEDISVEYSVVYTPYDSSFTGNVIAPLKNGGNSAGTYVITAKFTDKDTNYNAIADMTATLTIKQKTYVFSDAELGASKEVNGMITWPGLAYNTDAKYKPTMGTLASYFDVTYKYEKQAIRGDTSSWADITEMVEEKGGFNEGGMYRITAMLKIVGNAEMSNNYGAISDVVVYRDIADGVVTGIKVTHKSGYMYVYGDTLDMKQFMEVEVFYAGDGNPSKKLDEFSSVAIFEYQNDVKGAAFTTFNRADSNYKLLIEYYGYSDEITLNVGKASYDVSGLGFEQTNIAQQFDGQNHLPVLANGDGNYGIKGKESKQVVEGANLKVTYWVSKKNADNSWGEKVEVPADDLAHELLMHVGEYRVYVTIAQSHPCYNDIVVPDSVFATVTISKLQVVDDSVVALKWQYREAGASEWTDLGDKTAFDFIGKAYEFRMAFAGVGRDGDHEVIPTYQRLTAVSEVKDQGEYTLTATGNGLEDYAFTKTTKLTVLQKEVDLIWKVNSTNGQDGTLLDATTFTYTGADQIGSISVYYVDVNGAYVKIEGLTTAGNVVKDAKTYTLSIGEPADGNYKVKTGVAKTHDVTVNPFVVKGSDADRNLEWQFMDSDNAWKAISGNLAYKGNKYEVRLQFAGVGEDGTMTANVTAGEGIEIRNATSGNPYNLTAVAFGNYAFEDASVKQSLSIDKAKVSVTWDYTEAFTYNGEAQTVSVTAKGIGAEATTELLDKAAMLITKTDVSADAYVANAQLTAEAAVNYEFAADAKLSLEWRIVPATLNFDWSDGPNYAFKYTGSAVAPTATPRTSYETGAQYEISRKVGEEWEKITEAITVGEYKIACVKTNINYTLNGSETAECLFKIEKATPVVTSVAYNEYDVSNKSYQNNTPLRNDKLSYDTSATGAVKGTLAFENAENALATSNNSVSVRWTFTPEDTNNYENVSGSLVITLEAQKAMKLVADTNNAKTAYPVDTKFSREGVEVYVEYASCYYDEVLNRYFGKRDLIEDNTKVTMTINGTDTASKTGYTFLVTEKGTEQTVKMTYVMGADTLLGEFKVNVLKDNVTSIEVLNKSAVESLTLYEKYSYNLYKLLGEDTPIQIQVNYETAEADPFDLSAMFTVTCNNVSVSNGVLRFESAGTYTIGIDYSNAHTSFILNVSAKEDLQAVIDIADRIVLPEGGSVTLPAPKISIDGSLSELKDYGLSYVIKYADGSQVTEITECGRYTVTVEFAFIDEHSEHAIRYNLPATLTEEFEVVDKLPYEVTGRPILGDNLTMDYTGNHVEYGVDKESISITLDGQEVTLDGEFSVSYKINNVDVGTDYRMINAGTYVVKCNVSFMVEGKTEGASIEYTITINKVVNELSISIESWQEGFDANMPTIEAKYGDVSALKVWFDTAEDGTFTSEFSAEAAKNWTAGNTYWLKVTMAADENGNYDEVSAKCSVKLNKADATATDPTTGENIGTITPSEPGQGVDSDGIFKIEGIADEAIIESLKSSLEAAQQEYGKAYDITFKYADGSDVELNGKKMKISLLIAEELRAKENLKVYYVDDEGNVTDMNATRDGDYMVFEVEHLSTYVITMPVEAAPEAPAAAGNGGWIAGVTIGGIVAVALVVAVVVIFLKKRKGA